MKEQACEFQRNTSKILVTGAAGFIGFHLVKSLCKKGFEVTGLDSMSGDIIDLQQARLSATGIFAKNLQYGKLEQSRKFENYSFVKLDITDQENIYKLFEHNRFDIVCHLAAKTGVRRSLECPDEYIRSNVEGFSNILEACRRFQSKRLLYASSSSVYGANTVQPYSVEQPTDSPISMYAATKKMNELMAHAYSHLYRLHATGLRFFTVYGPYGRPDMAPFIFTKAISEDKVIKVYNNGKMSRDFTYVDDIVQSITLLINAGVETEELCQLYNIGGGKPVELMGFISTIEKHLEKKAKKQFLPLQDGDMISTFADVKPLEKKIGYKPETSVEEGIRKFVEWYRNFYG